MSNTDFKAQIKKFTETPSVGTACGPMVSLLTEFFGDGFTRTFVPDGFCLFQTQGASPGQLRKVFIAHMDEIGGCVYNEHEDSWFSTRIWGTRDPYLYANAKLQAFDYLSTESDGSYAVEGKVVESNGENRLILHGGKIKPYRTVFTFDQESTFSEIDGETFVHGKAVDPRATTYAVCEAVRQLNRPDIGAIIVMAEECAMDVARKAVTYLDRNAPDLALVVNADVPEMANLEDARLDLPAIRVFEGHNFIDPSFGIRVATELMESGVDVHLSAARSGSQTLLFTPLAPTISIALPGKNIHSPVGTVSLLGIERTIKLLTAIAERY